MPPRSVTSHCQLFGSFRSTLDVIVGISPPVLLYVTVEVSEMNSAVDACRSNSLWVKLPCTSSNIFSLSCQLMPGLAPQNSVSSEYGRNSSMNCEFGKTPAVATQPVAQLSRSTCSCVGIGRPPWLPARMAHATASRSKRLSCLPYIESRKNDRSSVARNSRLTMPL